MTDWATFAGFAGVVLVLLLLLARASQSAIAPDAAENDATAGGRDAVPDGDAVPRVRYGPIPEEESARRPGADADSEIESGSAPDADADDAARIAADDPTARDGFVYPLAEAADPGPGADASPPGADASSGSGRDPLDLSTTALLANVAVSQGLFGSLLVFGAWYAGVPASAFGVTAAAAASDLLASGAALGVALYVFNEFGAVVGDRLGVGGSERLRAVLAPDSVAGWIVLMAVVLPIIAGFEELLFRGVLIGALHAGFGVSPWLLAVFSSVAFALGHGAQGPGGVLVTGVLGFVLAAAFVVTESLPAVILAHYLVNALEFAIHEGIDADWAPSA